MRMRRPGEPVIPRAAAIAACALWVGLLPGQGLAQSAASPPVAPQGGGSDTDALLRRLDLQAQEIQELKSRLHALEAGQAPQRAASADAPAAPVAQTVGQAVAALAGADSGPLTLHGITLYGTVDIGVAYQSHGAPLSSYASVGVQSLISKSSNRAITSIAPNGLSQSKIGLRGSEALFDDWSAVFRLETGFQPTSGQLADGPRSVAQANGVALASQTTAADSSHAGQAFNRAAYAGLSNPLWGTVTFGRQTTILADQVGAYDPQQSSYAFSLVGYSGVTGGAGATQDYRLDNAIKYTNQIGPVRVGGLFQFGEENGGNHGNEGQLSVGGDIGDFSIDGTYTHKQDMINIASLSATQVPQVAQLGYSPGTSLAATVSDNTSFAVMASYKLGQAKLFGGYEYIDYANPSVPLRAGSTDIGGYTLAFVNNTAYTHHKILQVEWTGFRYALTPRLTWSNAYYHYDQNSFSGNGCQDSSAATCAGQLDAVSTVFDYRLSLRFDAYAGVMYSHVSNGLAAGYLHTGTLSPAGGVRFNF